MPALGGDTLRVLAIGNSFSEDAIEQYLYPVAKAAGVEMVVANMYIGGCTLERHVKNIREDKADYQYRKVVGGKRTNTKGVALSSAVVDEPWDFVMMQQGAGLYGVYESYRPDIDSLMAYVKARVTNPSCKYVIHQIWANPQNSWRQDYLSFYGGIHEQMYLAEVATTRRIARELGFDLLLPTGTAIENLRSTFVKDNYHRDGHHLNRFIGRYTASLAAFELLTGISCLDNSYLPDHLMPAQMEAAKLAAHSAVASPDEPVKLGSLLPVQNRDESLVEPYVLPELLRTFDGRKVRTARQWERLRRGELLECFESNMFGRAPGRPEAMSFSLLESDPRALGGRALRKQVRVTFDADGKRYMDLLIYLPSEAVATAPVPVVMGINFFGNHTVCADTAILVPDAARLKQLGAWSFAERGSQSSRWPIEMILDAGFGLVTFCCADVDPDFDDGFANGVHPLSYRKGQSRPEPDEWGTLAAWAWGLSRALDCLETDADIDCSRVALIGHSRMGKTALWAAARDERFAAVISNESGCGGAALSRRRFGETVRIINTKFPYWYCANFHGYNDAEGSLPFDQHELLALIAPRPLYVASASDDLNSDPVGEQLSLEAAMPAYRLYGRSAMGKVGHHTRPGRHEITSLDWEYYLAFLRKVLTVQGGR